MPKLAASMPRAPAEAKGRRRSTGIGWRPCSMRSRLTAAARSGAVSANVPSRSNKTARPVLLRLTNASQQIVDVAIWAEAVALSDRVVGHADQLVGPQPARAAIARELGGLDEALVVVRALRQEAKQVLGADHGEEIGLRIAVER